MISLLVLGEDGSEISQYIAVAGRVWILETHTKDVELHGTM